MILEDLNHQNPGEVLAACGLQLLAVESEPSATLVWPPGRMGLTVSTSLEELLGRILARPPVVTPSSANSGEPAAIAVAGLTLDWWHLKNRDMKIWAGGVTAATLCSGLHAACRHQGTGHWLAETPCDQKFGVDPFSSWSGLDVGWSPYTQKRPILTRPWVDLLAFIGCQGFAPVKDSNGFRYSLWHHALSLLPARLALQGAIDVVPTTRYRLTYEMKGKLKVFNLAQRTQ